MILLSMNRNSSIDSQKSVSNPDGPHAGSSKKRFLSRAIIDEQKLQH